MPTVGFMLKMGFVIGYILPRVGIMLTVGFVTCYILLRVGIILILWSVIGCLYDVPCANSKHYAENGCFY